MGSIASKRIKYAWGAGSSRTGYDLDEGAPVRAGAHVPLNKIIDGTSAPTVTKAEPGILANTFHVGGIYYIARPSMIWSASWAKTFLDVLYEGTGNGAGPIYQRTYLLSDVPSEVSEWLSWWKWTAKAGNEVVQVATAGVAKGFTLEIPQHGPAVFTPEIALAFCRDDYAGVSADAGWDLPVDGDVTPWTADKTILTVCEVGGTPAAIAAFRGIRLTASWEVLPQFWAGQNPTRISRGRFKLDGEIVFRDTDDEIEVFNSYVKDETELAFMLIDTGGAGTFIYFNARVHAGGGEEDPTTRLGRYNLTLIKASAGTYQEPLTVQIGPDRP